MEEKAFILPRTVSKVKCKGLTSGFVALLETRIYHDSQSQGPRLHLWSFESLDVEMWLLSGRVFLYQSQSYISELSILLTFSLSTLCDFVWLQRTSTVWGFSLIWDLNFEIWAIFFNGFYHVTRTLLPSVTLDTMGNMHTELVLFNKRHYAACDHCPCKNDMARNGKNEYRGCPRACHYSTVSQKSAVPFYVPCSVARFLLLLLFICMYVHLGLYMCVCWHP